jgi:hypothetical protein
MEAVMEWTPQRIQKAAKVVRRLREDGYSYEDIAEGHLVDVEGDSMEVWQVYSLCNPGKSAAQVAAWKASHCPD